VEIRVAACVGAVDAFNDALLGNCEAARAEVKPGYAGRLTFTYILFVKALCRQSAEIGPLERDNLGKPHEEWWWNLIELPTIHAAVELSRGRPERAIELLHPVLPYEPRFLLPAYVRGFAYLGLRRGSEATLEFKKLLVNKGAVWMLSSPGFQTVSPLGQLYPLSYLGLARARSPFGRRGEGQESLRRSPDPYGKTPIPTSHL